MNINTNLDPSDFRGGGAKNQFSPLGTKNSGISVSEMNQANTAGTSQSTYQRHAGPNHQMRQSMNKNTEELNEADKNRLKGHSQNNLYQSIQGPGSTKNKMNVNNMVMKSSQRIQSGNINKTQ